MAVSLTMMATVPYNWLKVAIKYIRLMMAPQNNWPVKALEYLTLIMAQKYYWLMMDTISYNGDGTTVA